MSAQEGTARYPVDGLVEAINAYISESDLKSN